VSIEEIERNLGIPVAGTVADDPKAALAAVNEQVLLRDMAPRSSATTGIADLVSLITDGAERVLPTSSSSRLGWLFS
jgi:Flp pilus assembly CpaE family ATPase